MDDKTIAAIGQVLSYLLSSIVAIVGVTLGYNQKNQEHETAEETQRRKDFESDYARVKGERDELIRENEKLRKLLRERMP
jgi:cell shape-determining protein MreC